MTSFCTHMCVCFIPPVIARLCVPRGQVPGACKDAENGTPGLRILRRRSGVCETRAEARTFSVGSRETTGTPVSFCSCLLFPGLTWHSPLCLLQGFLWPCCFQIRFDRPQKAKQQLDRMVLWFTEVFLWELIREF